MEDHSCSENLNPTLKTINISIVGFFSTTVKEVVANEVNTEHATGDNDQDRNGH